MSTATTDTATKPATATPKNFKDVQAVLARDTPPIGEVCWWTLSDSEVSAAALKTAWVAAGLNEKDLPKDQTPEKAFRLAAREAATTTVSGADKGILVRPTLEDSQHIIYAVVVEGHDEAGNYISQQKALVMLDRASGDVTSDDEAYETVRSFQSAYKRFLTTFPSRDVMSTVVKAVRRLNAIPLRETGGIYFVPPTPLMEKLQEVVGGISSSNRFYRLPVHETDEGAASLGAAANGFLEKELAGLQAEVEGWLTRDGRAVRKDAIENRMEEFSALRRRAQLYRDVLGVTVEDVEAMVEAMEAKVRVILKLREDD